MWALVEGPRQLGAVKPDGNVLSCHGRGLGAVNEAAADMVCGSSPPWTLVKLLEVPPLDDAIPEVAERPRNQGSKLVEAGGIDEGHVWFLEF
ncbi:hypothetical protein GCM10023066_06650 [Nocardioides kongjuensis]